MRCKLIKCIKLVLYNLEIFYYIMCNNLYLIIDFIYIWVEFGVLVFWNEFVEFLLWINDEDG